MISRYWRVNTPWGHTCPDYGRPGVRQFIRDNALYWLEEFHLDGLRFDATAHIRNVTGNENEGDNLSDGWNLLRWINDEINTRQPVEDHHRRGLAQQPRVMVATTKGAPVMHSGMRLCTPGAGRHHRPG